ncbi:MAG: nucleotide sugar dehydrogenase, partial [Planctomycetes bacterium]|nr:nucleotide sugar dehydrogenase [Planctomycetota bacterium]
IAASTEAPFTIACNPEFLKAGSAVGDFREPDRVVAGCDDERSFELLRELYRDFTGSGPLLEVDTRTAELIKYASNAMLACRISFMNSLAGLCEQLGADVGELARGVGLDSRIGPGALAASPGYGGSCLPKDIRALIDTLKEHGLDASLFEAIDSVNESQKASHIERLRSFLGDLRDRRIAVLGLSFKAGSSDIANSAAVKLIGQLIEEGAEVAAWDPAAMENMRRVFPGIEYSKDPYEASRGASAIVVLTEWDSLRALDFQTLGGLVSNKRVPDGRGPSDPAVLLALGFSYSAVGRPPTLLEPGCPENAVDSRDSES